MSLRTAFDLIQWATADIERSPLVCESKQHAAFASALCSVLEGPHCVRVVVLLHPRPGVQSPVIIPNTIDGVPPLLARAASSHDRKVQSGEHGPVMGVVVVVAPGEQSGAIYMPTKERLSAICRALDVMRERAPVTCDQLPALVVRLLRCIDHALVSYRLIKSWRPTTAATTAARGGVHIELPAPDPSRVTNPDLNAIGCAYVMYSTGVAELHRLGVRKDVFDGLLEQFASQIVSGSRVGGSDQERLRAMSSFHSVTSGLGDTYTALSTTARSVDAQLRGFQVLTSQTEEVIPYALRLQAINEDDEGEAVARAATHEDEKLARQTAMATRATIQETSREWAITSYDLHSFDQFQYHLLYHQHFALLEELPTPRAGWSYLTVHASMNAVKLALTKTLIGFQDYMLSVPIQLRDGSRATLLAIADDAWLVYRVHASLMFSEAPAARPSKKSCARVAGERRNETWHRLSFVPHIAQLVLSTNPRVRLAGFSIIRQRLGMEPLAQHGDDHMVHGRISLALGCLEQLTLSPHNALKIASPLFAVADSDGLQCSPAGLEKLKDLEQPMYPRSSRAIVLFDRIRDQYCMHNAESGLLLELSGELGYKQAIRSNKVVVPDTEGKSMHHEAQVCRQKQNARRLPLTTEIDCSSMCEQKGDRSKNLLLLLHMLEVMRFDHEHTGLLTWQQVSSSPGEDPIHAPSTCLSTALYPIGLYVGDGGISYVYPTDGFYMWQPVVTPQLAVGDRWSSFQREWVPRCLPAMYMGHNQRSMVSSLPPRVKVSVPRDTSLDDDSTTQEKKGRLAMTTLMGGGMSLTSTTSTTTTTLSLIPQQPPPPMSIPASSSLSSLSSSSSSSSSSPYSPRPLSSSSPCQYQKQSLSLPFNRYGSHTGSHARPLFMTTNGTSAQ